MRTRSLLAGILAASLASAAGAQVAGIGSLPAATTPLAGTEALPCVQGGAVKQCSAQSLGAALAACSPSSTCSLSGAWSFSHAILTGASIDGTPVGATTPSTGAFTTLSASGAVSGAGFSTYLASPPAIGGTTPAAGSFTTLSASGLITPSSTAGIKGTAAADNAQAGSVGEYLSASFSAVSMSGSLNLASLSLTPGDWDVSGAAQYSASSGTYLGNCAVGVSTTSANFGSAGTYAQLAVTAASAQVSAFATSSPLVRINVSASTTVYLVGLCSSTGTATAAGIFQARRIR